MSQKRITVRLVTEQTRKRGSAKNPEIVPGHDAPALCAWVQEQLEPVVHARWNDTEIEVLVVPSRSPEIRIDGAFPSKVGEIREFVSQTLEGIMENLEADMFREVVSP